MRAVLAILTVVACASTASAQDRRLVEVQFVPTDRAQLALWIESADGERFRTLRLTESVSYRGIGNRPGAGTMNSGFRWPYGRREGVLPVWAHRRVEAGGAPFTRVVFQSRPEGYASRTREDHSLDDHFCLAFTGDSSRDGLDAVSCASPFNSDKGRYLTAADVAAGYAEPFQHGTEPGTMRPLELRSLYPPRRDIGRCELGGPCHDSEDLATFADDAVAAMPELDAVTMATPRGEDLQRVVFEVPEEWPSGVYVVWLEVNVEGDYNARWNGDTFPTPSAPSGQWDYWAATYGYPFRGQPSVVFQVPITIGGGDNESTVEPHGYGSLSGTGPDGGEVRSMDDTVTDDPEGAPGSGADRLLLGDAAHRLRVVTVGGTTPPDPPMPPECDPEDPDPPRMCCEMGHPACDPDPDPPDPPTCEGALICLCLNGNEPPGRVTGLEASPHEDEQRGHQWGHLRFVVPRDDGEMIARYEVRVGSQPIVDEASFLRAVPAKAAAIESMELDVPTNGEPGDVIEVDLGGLSPETRYYVGVRARDACDDPGEIATVELETTAVIFTTVSPCFVATAAYGTPMAREIGALRRLRDRHLRTNAIGRALVDAYYAVGPPAAEWIGQGDDRRAAARAILRPLVALADWLD